MRLFRYLILLVLCVWGLHSSAQQLPQYSQYLFNGVVINPAYAGSRGYINVNGLYRTQWTGMEDHPSTQILSVDGPLAGDNWNFGAYFINDMLGEERSTSLSGAISYGIDLFEDARLQAGASVGVTQLVLDGPDLITTRPNDPAIPDERRTTYRPDVDIGLYFYTEKYFLGASVADIITSSNQTNRFDVVTQGRHLFLTGGLVTDLTDFLKFRPSFMVKEDFNAPTNLDLTGFLIYNDIVWLGASYRTRLFNKDALESGLTARNAISGLLEVFPVEQLRIGYSYDFTLTELRDFTTHEFSVGYYFNRRPASRMLTPRYF